MEDLAVFTALNHSGPFGENFVKLVKKKIEKKKIYIYVIYWLRVGPYGEKIISRSQFFIIRTDS